MKFCLKIAGYSITCEASEQLPEAACDLTVTVQNPECGQQVQSAIVRELRSKYWPLSLDFEREILRERIDFELTNGHIISMFSFLSAPIQDGTIQEMADTIGTFAGRLKTPERILALRSIQVRSSNRQNPKSGDFFYGQAYISDGRFELYPASFVSGLYRNALPCSWLCGVMLHEATHLCLEEDLLPLWEASALDLGWRFEPTLNIVLPGGEMTKYVNIEPQRCATKYAALQRDDDRAESVAAFLLGAHVDHLRTKLLEKVLRSEEASTPCHAVHREPLLPVPEQLRCRIRPVAERAFSSINAVGENRPHSRMTLESYLARRRVL